MRGLSCAFDASSHAWPRYITCSFYHFIYLLSLPLPSGSTLCAAQAILGAEYSDSADIWSLACMVFELVTGDFLFYPKDSEEQEAESTYSKDEDHLAQVWSRGI
jgi:serine/threonine protein kinase